MTAIVTVILSIVMFSSTAAISDHSVRISVLESKFEIIQKQLDRIEDKADKIIQEIK